VTYDRRVPAIADAVVPVAGLGTRLLPATLAQPKEMLPVVATPVVQYVVEELRAAGIERVLLVTRRGKTAIEDHFDAGAVPGVHVAAVRQAEPRGLGDAVLCGAGFAGDRPVAVALGDAILGRGTPSRIVAALGEALVAHDAVAAIAVQRVAAAVLGRYGVVAVEPAAAGVLRVTGLVEKPAPGAAPSDYAIAARYVIAPPVFGALRATAPDSGGEVQLTDALAALVAAGARVVAVPLPPGEPRFDIGTVESYCATFLEHALTHPELGPALRARARALLDGDG
jgi:UTP--glucose-1-phosphate uridylyltransferase